MRNKQCRGACNPDKASKLRYLEVGLRFQGRGIGLECFCSKSSTNRNFCKTKSMLKMRNALVLAIRSKHRNNVVIKRTGGIRFKGKGNGHECYSSLSFNKNFC